VPHLGSRYLGFELRTPFVASSSPLTGTLDGLRRLEDAGASAVVLPSLFEEELVRDALALHGALEEGSESFGEAQTYLPEPVHYESALDKLLELVAAAKDALAIPVIASLNGTTRGGWTSIARAIETAGADALELNLYRVAADPSHHAAELEQRSLELIAAVRAEVTIPLSVKLSPFFTALADFACCAVKVGADGLVLFNRFYQPDFDLETLEIVPTLTLSEPEELRLPLRWIALLSGRVKASLAASSGIHSARDALKALLAGADATMMASALLKRGPELLREMEQQMMRWLEEHEYQSVEQLKGSASQRASPDPEAFERAQYLRTLRSYAKG
jgi:dihydroorotate dehydrogenase (fumarate)